MLYKDERVVLALGNRPMILWTVFGGFSFVKRLQLGAPGWGYVGSAKGNQGSGGVAGVDDNGGNSANGPGQ